MAEPIQDDQSTVDVELRRLVADYRGILAPIDNSIEQVEQLTFKDSESDQKIYENIEENLGEVNKFVRDALRQGNKVIRYLEKIGNELDSFRDRHPHLDQGIIIEAEEQEGQAVSVGIAFEQKLGEISKEIIRLGNIVARAKSSELHNPNNARHAAALKSVIVSSLAHLRHEINKDVLLLRHLFQLEQFIEKETVEAEQETASPAASPLSEQVSIVIICNIAELRRSGYRKTTYLGLTNAEHGQHVVYRDQKARPPIPRGIDFRKLDPSPIEIIHGRVLEPVEYMTHYVMIRAPMGSDHGNRRAFIRINLGMPEKLYVELLESGFKLLNNIIEANLPNPWIEFLASTPVRYETGWNENKKSIFDSPRNIREYDEAPPPPPRPPPEPPKRRRWGFGRR